MSNYTSWLAAVDPERGQVSDGPRRTMETRWGLGAFPGPKAGVRAGLLGQRIWVTASIEDLPMYVELEQGGEGIASRPCFGTSSAHSVLQSLSSKWTGITQSRGKEPSVSWTARKVTRALEPQ